MDMHIMKDCGAYSGHPEGGLQDVGTFKLHRGFALVSHREITELRTKGAPDEAVPLLRETAKTIDKIILGVKLKRDRVLLEKLQDKILNLIGDDDEQTSA